VFKIDSTAGKRPDLGTSVYRLDKPLPLARLIRGAISTIWIGLGSFPISVRHRVDKVINERAHRLGGVFLRVIRVVRMLDGVAQVHVVANRDHQPAIVGIDASQMGLFAVLTPLIGPATVEE